MPPVSAENWPWRTPSGADPRILAQIAGRSGGGSPPPPPPGAGAGNGSGGSGGGQDLTKLIELANREIGFLTRIALDVGLMRRMMAAQTGRGGRPGAGGGAMDRGGYGGHSQMNAFRAGIDLVRGVHGLGTSVGTGKVGQTLYYAGQLARGLSYFRGGGGGGSSGSGGMAGAVRNSASSAASGAGTAARGAAAGGEAAAGGAGAAEGIGGALAGLASNPVTIALAAAAAVVIAEVAIVKALKDAADELIEFRRSLADVSPTMASIYAQRDMREMLRDRAKGEYLAQSTGGLIEAEQRYKDNIFPVEMAWEELKGNFLAGMYENLADLAGSVTEIAKTLGVISRQNQSASGGSFSDQVNQIAETAQKKQDAAKNNARRAR